MRVIQERWAGLQPAGKFAVLAGLVGAGLVGLALVVIVLGLVVRAGKSNLPTANETTAPTVSQGKLDQGKAPRAQRPALAELPAVTGWQLEEQYQNNPVRADKEYLDREVAIFAVVLEIIVRDNRKTAVLAIQGNGASNRILCDFDKADALTDVNQFKNVVVRGQCRGLNKGYIVLKGCEVFTDAATIAAIKKKAVGE